MTLTSRLRNAFRAFMNRSPTRSQITSFGSSYRPDRTVNLYGKTSIIDSVYNRIGVDAANIGLKHVILDKDDRYKEDCNDGLNECLTLSANKDQTGFDFIKDAVISLLDEGVIAILPVDTRTAEGYAASYDDDGNGDYSRFQNGFEDILSIRVGAIKEWYKDDVAIEAYDGSSGTKKTIKMPKAEVCIVENPFYISMNAQDSTAKRLSAKMRILDDIDGKNGSDRLDLIVQLPYQIRTPTKRALAKETIEDIERQLSESRYGIAYVDASERITQLNRPVENKIQEQIEYLTNLLFAQLGLTQEIMNGTASAEAMQNYYSRTITPILKAIAYEMTRKWLTPNARTRGHKVWFYQNPFELVPIGQIAEIVDKFTRNEIMTGNEMRQVLGMKPSDDPRADELRNKNLNASDEELAAYDKTNTEKEDTNADG